MVHVDWDAPCTIGRRVGVGHRAILHGCTVGDECLVGMGAVLPEGREGPPGSRVLGVPARIVRPVDEALRRRIETTWQHYLRLAREHGEGRYG